MPARSACFGAGWYLTRLARHGGTSAPGALRIEGAAVRDPEGDGRPVLLLDTGAEVEIDLDICASGYCTFLSDSVTEGTKVVLSGRLPTDG